MIMLGALALAVASTGCKKKPKAGSGVDDFGGMIGTPVGPEGYGMAMNPDDLQAVASQFSPIYFDYDSSQINAGQRSSLEEIADFLQANPSTGLIVEGHCDERGSNEYNLALGERRALAVRAYLIGLGVGADRIQTKSYGEERPASLGHDESSWSQNRRAEFSLF